VPSRALICRDGACLAILVAGERPPRPRARPRECVVDWYSFSNPRTTLRGAMRRRLLLHIRRTRGHTPAHQDEFAETLPTEALQTSLAGNAEIGFRFMQAGRRSCLEVLWSSCRDLALAEEA